LWSHDWSRRQGFFESFKCLFPRRPARTCLPSSMA
jgi:hypothetical protein